MRTDAPGHGANLGFRHARHHGPWPAFERCGDAVERFRGVVPERTLPRFFDQARDGRSSVVQRLYARRRHQPFVLLIQQCQRTGLADAETLEVLELRVLRIGVVEAYIQHGNDLAAAVAYRRVLRHVEASKKQGSTDVALPADHRTIGRTGAVEHGTNGPRTVLLAD
ncbi:hypothetical protein D3C80_1565680 [compost metagenome]